MPAKKVSVPVTSDMVKKLDRLCEQHGLQLPSLASMLLRDALAGRRSALLSRRSAAKSQQVRAVETLDQAVVEMEFDPSEPPDLRFTEILDAAIDGEEVTKADLYWFRLRDEMFRRAYQVDIGTTPREAANDCYHEIKTAAQELGVSLNIGIRWPSSKGSHPGKRGRIRWKP